MLGKGGKCDKGSEIPHLAAARSIASIAEVLEGGPLAAINWDPYTRILIGAVTASCRGRLVGVVDKEGVVWVLAGCVRTGTQPLAGPHFSTLLMSFRAIVPPIIDSHSIGQLSSGSASGVLIMEGANGPAR